MYRVTLICDGVPTEAGSEAAADITEHFQQHRKWHQSALCSWNGLELKLELENDFDFNGLASMDEFSDCISAFIKPGFDGDIRVQSITVF